MSAEFSGAYGGAVEVGAAVVEFLLVVEESGVELSEEFACGVDFLVVVGLVAVLES